MYTKIQKGRSSVSLIALAVQALIALPAFAQETHHFDLAEAANSAAAIQTFGQQSKIQIFASADDIKDKHLNTVTGDLTTDGAFQKLLAGTGLAPQYVGDRSVALVSTKVASDSPHSNSTPVATNPDAASNEVEKVSSGEEQRPAANSGTLPQVTVAAKRKAMEHQVYDFVRTLTKNPRFRDESLPRWNAPLCFAVAGLPTDQGLFALGRLREIARTTGMRVIDRGCRYNFFVVFTGEPNQLLKKAVHLHPEAFAQNEALHEIREFVTPSRPRAVRAWHNVETFNRDGTPVNRGAACATTMSLSGIFNQVQAPISCQYSASRIERYEVPAFTLALVVVDTTYPKQAKLGQLVDYAAMVGLADISPSADIVDVPSILNLFDVTPAAAPPEGLTNWDRAFLRELYNTEQASRTQRFQIVDKMLQDVMN